MAITTGRKQDDEFGDILKDSLIDKPRYDFGNILDYIQVNYDPQDIYDRGELDDWALANGYVKAEAAS